MIGMLTFKVAVYHYIEMCFSRYEWFIQSMFLVPLVKELIGSGIQMHDIKHSPLIFY